MSFVEHAVYEKHKTNEQISETSPCKAEMNPEAIPCLPTPPDLVQLHKGQ